MNRKLIFLALIPSLLSTSCGSSEEIVSKNISENITNLLEVSDAKLRDKSFTYDG